MEERPPLAPELTLPGPDLRPSALTIKHGMLVQISLISTHWSQSRTPVPAAWLSLLLGPVLAVPAALLSLLPRVLLGGSLTIDRLTFNHLTSC